MIRVYLAEDSPTVVEVFKRLLEGDPELQLVGVAPDGARAREELAKVKPDILVTDLFMPNLDGLELIRWVMAEHPLPILVLSNTAQKEGSTLAFECLEAGAMEIGPKLRGGTHLEENRKELRRLLRVLAGVRVLHRRPGLVTPCPTVPVQARIVGVGASTGGPQVFQTLFKGLPGFPIPLLVVQHISEGFLEGMVHWLSASTPIKARIAVNGCLPEPGHAYFAPPGRNMELDGAGRIQLKPGNGNDLHVPSVDALFHSLARNVGSRGCGVLLTGMGRDGAEGLLAMRRAGSWTVAQAQSDCLVYGMPKAAVELQAAQSVLELGLMPGFLMALCRPGA